MSPGRASLGIELGSTRIKACLVGPDGATIATGSHSWESRLVDGLWSYDLAAVREGVAAAYADLVAALGEAPVELASLGVSAMMHGYLAFGADGEPLVPFRTWRNTNAAPAATALSAAFGMSIPLRWSIAHLHQAVLDGEPHVPRIARLTTLSGYLHGLLTGRDVLGVGDASGMFPIDPETGGFHARLMAVYEGLAADAGAELRLDELLPAVLTAGADAGELTPEGAALLDPSGALRPGAPLCPPEGDAGTGMVATNAVRPRTGSVSVGTSVFAMVVLERGLARPRAGIDLVTTPAGAPVAMVHGTNGASELGAWAGLFQELAAAIGSTAGPDEVFAAVLGRALETGDDGILAYGLLAGEPLLGLAEGRPLVVRAPGSRLSLAGFARAQLFAVFAALSVGMRELAAEGVEVDSVVAHGGLLRTGEVAQRALAAALGTPVAVGEGAGEGGAWGIALLAVYRRAVVDGETRGLADWLAEEVFPAAGLRTVVPAAAEIADYRVYLERWLAGLAVERAAVEAVSSSGTSSPSGPARPR